MYIALGTVLVALLVLTIPIAFLTSGQYQALAGGAQALGVTAALVFGAATLWSDRQNRRVDRVLDLHDAITSGDVHAARLRLIDHLRSHSENGRIRPISLNRLREEDDISKYSSCAESSPGRDAARILRYMERANAARHTGIVENSLFHELVGIHVLWWNHAIAYDEGEPLCHAIVDLAAWVSDYKTKVAGAAYLKSWDANLHRDFDPGQAN